MFTESKLGTIAAISLIIVVVSGVPAFARPHHLPYLRQSYNRETDFFGRPTGFIRIKFSFSSTATERIIHDHCFAKHMASRCASAIIHQGGIPDSIVAKAALGYAQLPLAFRIEHDLRRGIAHQKRRFGGRPVCFFIEYRVYQKGIERCANSLGRIGDRMMPEQARQILDLVNRVTSLVMR